MSNATVLSRSAEETAQQSRTALERLTQIVLRSKVLMTLLHTLACPLVGLWPPLERIGDMTITAWRKREREAAVSR